MFLTLGRFPVALIAGLFGVLVLLAETAKDEKHPSCQMRLDNRPKIQLTATVDDTPEKFKCLSDVDEEEKGSPRTFVWIMHNDDDKVNLQARWDDVGFVALRFPPVCRMLTSQTSEKVPGEKDTHVVYGGAAGKQKKFKMYEMKDQAGEKNDDKKVKDDANSGDKKRRGSPIRSRILVDYKDDKEAKVKTIDIVLESSVDDEGKLFSYSAGNYTKKDILFDIPGLTEKWRELRKTKDFITEADHWEVDPAKSGYLLMKRDDESSGSTKEALRNKFTLKSPRAILFHEETTLLTVYFADDIKTPVASGKVSVYLPKEK